MASSNSGLRGPSRRSQGQVVLKRMQLMQILQIRCH